MIKKILKFLGIFLIVVLALLFTLPFLFKDTIIEKVKEEANNNLNAKVDFGEFDLSIISSFPDFNFSINDVKVSGIDKFEGIDLAKIKQLNLSLDLMSVINGDNYKIKTIEIIQPQIKAIVLADSTANWDIAKDTGEETVEEETTEESTPFKLELQNFSISDADIYYEDATMDLSTDIKKLNFSLSGDMSQDFTTLNTKTTIDTFTVIMENIPYLNKTKIEANADIDADLANSKYTFKENEFKVNELALGLNGWLALIEGTEENPDGSIDMDLTFEAKQTDFKTILSLVPAVYMTDFNNVKTEGQLALQGYAKGEYIGESLPAFGLDLQVNNAMFKYPDLPKSVKQIAIDLHIDNPGGSDDNTNIDLNKFHMEIAGNPIDAAMKIRKPISDPDIQAELKAKLDLASIKDVLPMEEGEDYNGKIASDVRLKGKVSALEQERYEDFDAQGTFSIMEMNYKSADLPYDVWLNEMTLNFSPQKVSLQNFDSKVGKTDIQANGDIENFIQYAFADDQVLKGNFNVTSNYMDLNEFMEEDSTATEATADTLEEALEVIEVPANIDFALNADFKKVHYDNMDIDNAKGKLLVKDQKVSMEDVSMDMLGGSMLMNGYYETTNPKEPGISFGMKVKNFDVEQVVSTFNTVEKLAPVAKACKGRFNVDMSMDGLLDDKLEPKLESLNGLGDMLTQNLQVVDFKPMVKLSSALQNEKFKKIDLGNSFIKFSFKDGKVNVEPFNVQVGNYKGKMWGYNSLDQTMEYT
ncbi:MAG TPA: membrane assembly protein AsmA, partial [Flavobacteriales bacterium]|nr:membrane assembly protein AsmA [Flavobacteriales bacterium]